MLLPVDIAFHRLGSIIREVGGMWIGKIKGDGEEDFLQIISCNSNEPLIYLKLGFCDDLDIAYSRWATKERVLLVEFGKIKVFCIWLSKELVLRRPFLLRLHRSQDKKHFRSMRRGGQRSRIMG